MDAKERAERLRAEKGKALVRQLHLTELQAAGAARELALYEAEQQLTRIAKLLPGALEGGLSLTEIARITNVSRPTLYELRARYGGTMGDLRLAVLQMLATTGPMWHDEIHERLAGRDGIDAVLGEFLRGGLIEFDTTMSREQDNVPPYEVTPEGFETLENWNFALDQESEEGE